MARTLEKVHDASAAITPVIYVQGGAQAVEFYQRAFGAREIHRNTAADGRVVVEMALGHARFRVADESPEVFACSPATLGATTVRINVLVDDPDEFVARAVAAGATAVAPVADQPYGLRQGRVADPFGHQWLIGCPLAGAAGDWARRAG